MKHRFRSVFAVLFAGVAGILGAVIVRPSPSLYAQADPMCVCTKTFSSWCVGSTCSPLTNQCTGTSTLSTIPTCSSVAVGQYCVLSGALTWSPATPNCQVNISNGGLIGPTGGSNMALYYFDARTASGPVAFAYSNSTVCQGAGGGFGWILYVASNFSTQIPVCTCTATDHWQIQGQEAFFCKPE